MPSIPHPHPFTPAHTDTHTLAQTHRRTDHTHARARAPPVDPPVDGRHACDYAVWHRRPLWKPSRQASDLCNQSM